MNRREMLVSAFGAATLALPLPALAAQSRIVWKPGTFGSQHALMVARSIHHVIDAGVLYTTGDFSGMGNAIPLTDPRFVVDHSDIMFHPTRGFRYEHSLTVDFYERGTRLGQSIMCSNADYEAYWREPKPADRPDFWLIAPHTPYERHNHDRQIRDADWQVVEKRPGATYVTTPEIEARLGRNAVKPDMRWIEHMIAEKDA